MTSILYDLGSNAQAPTMKSKPPLPRLNFLDVVATNIVILKIANLVEWSWWLPATLFAVSLGFALSSRSDD